MCFLRSDFIGGGRVRVGAVKEAEGEFQAQDTPDRCIEGFFGDQLFPDELDQIVGEVKIVWRHADIDTRLY